MSYLSNHDIVFRLPVPVNAEHGEQLAQEFNRMMSRLGDTRWATLSWNRGDSTFEWAHDMGSFYLQRINTGGLQGFEIRFNLSYLGRPE